MSFVETKVKTLSVKEGKNVVVEGVKVREVYAAASRYDENMRGELLILLLERVALRGARRGDVFSLAERGKPDDDISRRTLRGMVCSSSLG
jgi:hypothetical protein